MLRKLRIVPREHVALGEDPTTKDLARSIDSVGLNIHHNFKAVEQEFEDVRAQLHVVGKNAAEGLATGQRVEMILTELAQIARVLSDKVAAIEARVNRSEAPTEPALPRAEDLDAG